LPVTSCVNPRPNLLILDSAGERTPPGGVIQSITADFRDLMSSALAVFTPFCSFEITIPSAWEQRRPRSATHHVCDIDDVVLSAFQGKEALLQSRRRPEEGVEKGVISLLAERNKSR
jgi:hypothetical protein